MNPIAVNSKYCNVFTENKRAVSVIESRDFGKVCTDNPSHDGSYAGWLSNSCYCIWVPRGLLGRLVVLLRPVHVFLANIGLQMAFVAIGATMVGSITFTRKVGDKVKKGEEVSSFKTKYFSLVCTDRYAGNILRRALAHLCNSPYVIKVEHACGCMCFSNEIMDESLQLFLILGEV